MAFAKFIILSTKSNIPEYLVQRYKNNKLSFYK